MKIVFNTIVLSSIVLLAGCVGPLVRIEQIDDFTKNKVQVYPDNSILQKAGVNSLGIVEATSCRNQAWEPPASLENCTAQMQMRAAKLGANGLIVGAGDRQVANFVTTGINRNCWSTVDCTGIAIIVVEESPETK
ncbi:RcsF-like lipoprotein [Limnobacter thiooxidans]|uniref:Lipoprotein n=1 Tax=Limnobacter thiooxidans TaxID=131080 RepID=A0AA86J2U4_9BURK|nr:RcsF-like lipoprotein [Limnobacter thiooxidans]BET26686.1 hypothetical protein RGQ30_21870 [Limnobacter thiooxidans]